MFPFFGLGLLFKTLPRKFLLLEIVSVAKFLSKIKTMKAALLDGFYLTEIYY